MKWSTTTSFNPRPISVVADIESIFFQVRVREKDQDAQRILWWTYNDYEQVDEYVRTVHIFGVMDSPCVANSCLRKTAEDNRKSFEEDTVQSVLNNFYVDDLLKPVSSPKTVTNFAVNVMALCEKGGFKLMKFLSNDRDVLASIPIDRHTKSFVDLDLEKLSVERALGVKWDLRTTILASKLWICTSRTLWGWWRPLC